MTCETISVNRSLLRAAWLVAFPALLVLSFVATACDSSATPTMTDEPTRQPEALSINEDIPVEALPDPLPAPYLFTDEVTFEPELVTETVYVVQPGDNLAAIAGRFCITVEEIQRLNTIVDIAQISVGQELRIPIREGACGAAAPETVEASAEPSEPQRPPGEIYIVQDGDTLSGIAGAFGFTWVELMNYNGLTEAEANALPIGSALIIPPPPDQATQSDESGQSEQSGSSEPPG